MDNGYPQCGKRLVPLGWRGRKYWLREEMVVVVVGPPLLGSAAGTKYVAGQRKSKAKESGFQCREKKKLPPKKLAKSKQNV